MPRGATFARQLPVRASHRGPTFSRQQSGQSLVEVLFALLIAGIIAASLANTYSGFMRFTTGGEQSLKAMDIAQEVIDALRNTSWTDLQNAVPTSPCTLMVNKTSAGQAGPTIDVRPLMLDQTQFTFSNQAIIEEFRGTCTLTLTQAGAGQPIAATVDVTWPLKNGGTGKYSAKTLLSQYGVHQ